MNTKPKSISSKKTQALPGPPAASAILTPSWSTPPLQLTTDTDAITVITHTNREESVALKNQATSSRGTFSDVHQFHNSVILFLLISLTNLPSPKFLNPMETKPSMNIYKHFSITYRKLPYALLGF